MAKLFTVVGVSTLNGAVKLRFANDIALRTKVLLRNEHKDVRLMECAEMTKLNAALFLKTQEAFSDEATQAVIAAYLAKNG